MERSRSERIERIRADIARVAGEPSGCACDDVLPFGIAELDGKLTSGGIGRRALHEFAPASQASCDDAAATLFVAALAARLRGPSGAVLWAVTRYDLYGPGLEQAGLAPDLTIHAEARDDAEVLALMEDALRNGGLAAVVGEVQRVGMTASRRLQLAAADARCPALLLRRWRKQDACPLSENSAAWTRWRIASVPSARLPFAGVGRGRWHVELAKQRGGASFNLVVEACDEQGRLALPAHVADRATAAAGATRRAA